MFKKISILILFIFLILLQPINGFSKKEQNTSHESNYDKSTLLVRFKSITSKNKDKVVNSIDGYLLNQNYSNRKKFDVIKINNGNIEEVYENLKNNPNVDFVQYNYKYHSTLIPNDPNYSLQYCHNNTGQTGGTVDADMDSPEAWEITTGSSDIVIGVVDTGIDYTHPDLQGNLWVNPLEIPDNQIDDDNNGYVDDVYGINAITGSGDPFDDHFHGTACAGIIGAKGNNNIQVVGVNWNVKMVALKFLDCTGS